MSLTNIAVLPRRLALVFGLQIATCVYCVLGVSAFVKINSMSGDIYYPASDWSLWMKHYGWLLMALPIAWFWFHVRCWMREGADFAYLAQVVLSGVALLAILFLLGLTGTAGTMRTRHIVAIERTR
jgi:hypothetical protein